MNKIYLLTFLIITSFFINAQDAVDTQEEVDPNVERVEKIQDLINRVEENREELSLNRHWQHYNRHYSYTVWKNSIANFLN